MFLKYLISNLDFSMRFVINIRQNFTLFENNTIPIRMNSNIIDRSIAHIVNIVQVGCWVIGISVLPENIWSDQAIFENVYFFFYIKTTFKLFSCLFQKVFFSPNDLKCYVRGIPSIRAKKRTLTTIKVHLYQTLQTSKKK